MLEGAGYPDTLGALARIARHLKIPAATLHRWAQEKQNPPPSELVTVKRIELKELLRAEIDGALSEMVKARPTAEYRDLGTVMGILFDKLQLLENKPTSIEHVTLTDNERTERVNQLLDAARARRTGQSSHDTPQ